MFIKLWYIIINIINNYIDGKILEIFWKIITRNFLEKYHRKFSEIFWKLINHPVHHSISYFCNAYIIAHIIAREQHRNTYYSLNISYGKLGDVFQSLNVQLIQEQSPSCLRWFATVKPEAQ